MNSEEDNQLVLSEIHWGEQAGDEDCTNRAASCQKEEYAVSRYRYLTAPLTSHGTDSSSPGRSDSYALDDSSSSEGKGSDGSSTVIRRRRARKRARISQNAKSPKQQPQSKRTPTHEVLTVVHRMATTLDLVGQQVWSAAFLMGDFVLTHDNLFAERQVLELGAGTGLPGMVAARVARRVYLTDYHDEVLAVLARNADANAHLFFHRGYSTGIARDGPAKGSATVMDDNDTSRSLANTTMEAGEENGVVAVRKLDWFETQILRNSSIDNVDASALIECRVGDASRSGGCVSKQGDCPYDWRDGELNKLLSMPSDNSAGGVTILASDVIYDEGLTEAFFGILKTLMPPPAANHYGGHEIQAQRSPVLYMGLEKRFNFSIAELSVAATGYKALLRNVLDITDGHVKDETRTGKCAQDGQGCQEFTGVRLPLDFAQCFRYNRSEAMELWEIRRRPLRS